LYRILAIQISLWLDQNRKGAPSLSIFTGKLGLDPPEVSRRLSVSPSALRYWIKANKEGKLKEVGKWQKPLTELEMELARVKRELAMVKMERDILKNATAYFAKESLPGTRS